MIPNSDELNWIIAPAGSCVSYIAEETKLAALIHRGLIAIRHLEEPLLAARHVIRAASLPTAATDELLKEQATLKYWADEILESDLHPVNVHGLIGMWCALEVAIEDTAVLILSKDLRALQQFQPEATQLLEEDQARRMYRKLEQKERSDNRSAFSAFTSLLRKLDVPISLRRTLETQLDEINAVRNCLLHRGGIIDERAAKQAPRLRPLAGKQFKLGKDRYLEYYTAIGDFAQELLKAVLASRFIRVQLKHPRPSKNPPTVLKIFYDILKDEIKELATGVSEGVQRAEIIARVLAKVSDRPEFDSVNLEPLIDHVLSDLEARGQVELS